MEMETPCIEAPRSTRNFKQTVKRLSWNMIPPTVLRRWLVALKETIRVFEDSTDSKASAEFHYSPTKPTVELYVDPDRGGEPMNFYDVFLYSEALEGMTLSMKLVERQNLEKSLSSAGKSSQETTELTAEQGKIQHASSRASSSASNLHRQNLSRSSAHASTPRVTQARVPTSTRMTRPRGCLPGQPRTISSRQSDSPVPLIMDVMQRMLFDIGMAGGFIQSEHDFNEVLLALHNNRQHGGASAAQIHGSPGSKVQVLLEGYGGAYTSTLKQNQDKAIILYMLVNKRMMATLGLTPRL